MATLTIRLPDDTHQRLKSLAEKRHLSINKLFAEFDAETRFLAQATRGNPERGLELLDKIDQHFGSFFIVHFFFRMIVDKRIQQISRK